MTEQDVEFVEHLVVTVAAVIGGLWALFRFVHERNSEAALDIATRVQSVPLPSGDHFVTVTLSLTNRGSIKLQAKPNRPWQEPAFTDGVETLRHSGSLQIRQVDGSVPVPNRHLDWFEGGPFVPVPGLPTEINVLSDYEEPRNGSVVDFWMEPGETYRFGVPVALPPGVFVAKVTFVGAGSAGNFWSQIFTFGVPCAATPP